jgi:hypothetical protein
MHVCEQVGPISSLDSAGIASDAATLGVQAKPISSESSRVVGLKRQFSGSL